MAKQALCEALSLDKSSTTTTACTAAANNNNISTNTKSAISTSSSSFSTLQDSKPASSGFGHSFVKPTTTYASSAENITKLLQNWMKTPTKSASENTQQSSENNPSVVTVGSGSSPSEGTVVSTGPMTPEAGGGGGCFDSFLSFNSSTAARRSDVSMAHSSVADGAPMSVDEVGNFRANNGYHHDHGLFQNNHKWSQ